MGRFLPPSLQKRLLGNAHSPSLPFSIANGAAQAMGIALPTSLLARRGRGDRIGISQRKRFGPPTAAMGQKPTDVSMARLSAFTSCADSGDDIVQSNRSLLGAQ
jgi:hypothetical protein